MNKKRSHIFVFFLMMMISCFLSFSVQASAAAKINKTSVTVNKGKTYTLKVTGTTKTVSWTSSNKKIATVSKTGVVKGIGKGTTTIKAKVGGKTLSCKVTVKIPVTKLTLNKTQYFLMPQKTYTLAATVSPSNANNKNITWTSSNKKIATVSSSGKVTGVSKGTAQITAKSKDNSKILATCKIIVLKPSTSLVNKTTTTTTDTKKTTDTTKTNTSTTTGASTRAKAFLKVLQKYSNRVASDYSKGIYWKYNTTYSNQPKTIDDAIAKNRRVFTCSWLITWALKDPSVGVLAYNGNLSNHNGGQVYYASKGTKESIEANCTVMKVSGTVRDLAKAGKLLPGDILTYSGHNNVFAGYNKTTGEITFFDSGRASSYGGYQSASNTFKSVGPFKTKGTLGKVTYIVRIN